MTKLEEATLEQLETALAAKHDAQRIAVKEPIEKLIANAVAGLEEAARLADVAGIGFAVNMHGVSTLQYVSPKLQERLEKAEETDYEVANQLAGQHDLIGFEDGWSNYGGGWMSS